MSKSPYKSRELDIPNDCFVLWTTHHGFAVSIPEPVNPETDPIITNQQEVLFAFFSRVHQDPDWVDELLDWLDDDM